MIVPMHRPTTYACTQCAWRRVVHRQDCVMVEGMNLFKLCPDCGCTELKVTRRDGLGSTALGELGRVLDRMFSSDKAPTKQDFINYHEQKNKPANGNGD